MVWAFGRGEDVRVGRGGKSEAAASVMEDEASMFGNDAGAEAAEERAVVGGGR